MSLNWVTWLHRGVKNLKLVQKFKIFQQTWVNLFKKNYKKDKK